MVDHYSHLLEWRRLEGSVRGLAKLPPDFYPATQTYLAELRRTFETELRENPSGRKGDMARQTYQRAGQVARDIVEARMAKLLSAAFTMTAGGSRDTPNALTEERTLFDGLVRLLKEHRSTAAPFLEPAMLAATAPGVTTPATPSSPAPSASRPTPEGAHEASSETRSTTTVFVRILRDGRPIEAGGETIDLRKEDVISLTPETARILVTSQIAERLGPDDRRAVT
ncbi:MAG: hypothetical protein WCA77_05940 [Thermoplasmata archaeon]